MELEQIKQAFRVTSRLSTRRKWNKFTQFRCGSLRAIPKNKNGNISKTCQGSKRSCKCKTNSPTYLFLQLTKSMKEAVKNNSLCMVTVFHVKPVSRFIHVKPNFKSIKLHTSNQRSHVPRASSLNRDNTSTSNQYRIERQSQHLQRWLFFSDRPTHFNTNYVKVTCMSKSHKLSFSRR